LLGFTGSTRGASHYDICDIFPIVVRLQEALLAFAAVFGYSGCLLFTDPINEAPVVAITSSDTQVRRDTQTVFTAQVTDDKDDPALVVLKWAEFYPPLGESCARYLAASEWVGLSSSNGQTYPFTPKSLTPVCLCVQATDSSGATAQTCTAPLTPDNPAPVAVITDQSTIPVGQGKHQLCKTVYLSAEKSTFPATARMLPGEVVQFSWSGTDPAGAAIQFVSCGGLAVDKDDLHRCFKAAVSGNYQIALTITDIVPAGKITITSPSSPAAIQIAVDVDRPACLLSTDPDVYAKTVVLSRSETRSFTVSNVADDCDPYPPAGTALQFVWSLFDPTQPSSSGLPQWVPQRDFKTTAFPVSQALFPNVRPGDTVQVRLEVRDTPTQLFYSRDQPGGPICTQDTAFCYGKDDAGKMNDCVRWTTWNVQFQP